MSIPEGYGTEVLKRVFSNNLSDTVVDILPGEADHIYTVLTVSFTERSSSTTELINMSIYSGSTDITLLASQPIGSLQTFTWNDKFVMVGTDILRVSAVTSASFDVWVSYIDQDFS